MSKIGQKPIPLPDEVALSLDSDSRLLTVKGKRGQLSRVIPRSISVVEKNHHIEIVNKDPKNPALWGTWRAHIANMVIGVTQGFRKELELVGVGYRAALEGNTLVLNVGFSHPVSFAAPAGINFQVEKNSVRIEGNDIETVGQIAAKIRAVRPPEPYKGKGIRYANEVIRRKEGKKAIGSE